MQPWAGSVQLFAVGGHGAIPNLAPTKLLPPRAALPCYSAESRLSSLIFSAFAAFFFTRWGQTVMLRLIQHFFWTCAWKIVNFEKGSRRSCVFWKHQPVSEEEYVSEKLSQSEVWPRFDGKWSIFSRGYCCIINKAKPAVPISQTKTPHARHGLLRFAKCARLSHVYFYVCVSTGEATIAF